MTLARVYWWTEKHQIKDSISKCEKADIVTKSAGMIFENARRRRQSSIWHHYARNEILSRLGNIERDEFSSSIWKYHQAFRAIGARSSGMQASILALVFSAPK